VAVLATLSVTVLPALAVDVVIPAGGLGGAIAGAACAVALSLAIAALEAGAWKHVHGGRGVVFSELMLWSFARRLWAERRLRKIASAYREAAGGGQARVELLEGLSRLLETRNPFTYGHCRRVARHAERIARAMRLSPAEVAEVRAAALIHDVGKVYTPVEILHKPGPLTDEEFAIVKRHCDDGAEMLAPVRDRRLAAIVRHHHERLDGSGYPQGLKGVEIPLGARIVAVADTFDAITSNRPYRRARSQREGLQVLAGEAGEKLDAAAVAAFLDDYTPRRSIASVSLSAAVWSRLAPVQLLPGGLLGGASLAGLLPAVGAAGLLAVAPAARYERAPRPSPVATGTTSLVSPLRGGLGMPPRLAPRRPGPQAARVGSPVRPRRAPAPRRRSATVGPSPARPVQPPAGALAPSVVARAPLPGPTSTLPALAVVPSASAPQAATPQVPQPPAVTVGPLTAPEVSVGSGGVKVGPIVTPGVAAGPVQVPSVTLVGSQAPTAAAGA
jgi:putative nucleotidyltransferase with HDIG domain